MFPVLALCNVVAPLSTVAIFVVLVGELNGGSTE